MSKDQSNVEKTQMPASSNCEHHYSSRHLPDFSIWIRQCSSCGGYDTKDMKQQLEALIASEITRNLEELKNYSDYDDNLGEFVPIEYIEEKLNYMLPKSHPGYWKYHCATCGKWTGHEMEDLGDDYCDCE